MNMLSMFDDYILKKVVEHVPFNWSNLAAWFLQFSNHCTHVVVTGKRVNQGAAFGLEKPVDYMRQSIQEWTK